MTTTPHGSFGGLLTSDVPVPEWWQSREPQVQGFLDRRVRTGHVRTIAVSPGGRPVRCAVFGEPEPELRGGANLNSALGAGLPDAYYRRSERKRPVLFVLAAVHGAEVEGLVGALSLIQIIETGCDLSGRPQRDLAEKLRSLRVLVIPLGNPDGRARTPYDGWVGLPEPEMHRINQGTRTDGSLYGWPGCKAVHPMRGDVGALGAYFDDAGVNLMHDEWGSPMSPVTRGLLELVRDEGPDLLLNCHSHGHPPAVLEIHYVPAAVKQEIAAFASTVYARLDAAGLAHGQVFEPREDGPAGTVPPALNLTSMFYHAGAALPMTFECPHGLSTAKVPFDYEQILQIHHALYESAADWLLRRVKA